MARRKNTNSWTDLALESPWPVSALIAVGVLILGFVIAPMLAGDSKALTAILKGFKPVIWLVAGCFGLLALVKWATSFLRARAKPDPFEAYTNRSRTSATNSQVASPVPGIRREPSLQSGNTVPPATEWSLRLLQDIEWKRFEDLCQKFYEAKGIRSACTPLGPDGGIDIRLFQDDSGQATAIVQCKAWGDSFVGVKPIRELLGVMVHEKVGKAFFMTSGKYSEEAKAFAAPNRITLIDGSMFLAMIQRLPEPVQETLLRFATAGDYTTPSCPTCGTKMRLVPGKEGNRDFWGCSNFPKCRQKLGVRRGAGNLPAAVIN